MDDIVPPDSLHNKLHYVYVLCYPDGRVFYVGKGQGNRINEHEYEVQGTRRICNIHKVNTIKKIWREGGQVVKKILAHFETEEAAFMYERSLIFFMDGLTNLTDGGEGISGLIQTPESIAKRVAANTGKRRSEETKERISKANGGKKRSEEVRRQISERMTGRKQSEEVKCKRGEGFKASPRAQAHLRKLHEAKRGKPDPSKGKPRPSPSSETRRKLSDTLKGHTVTEESRRKMSEANKGRAPWHKDKKYTEEHRRKLSEAHQGTKWSAKRREAYERNKPRS